MLKKKETEYKFLVNREQFDKYFAFFIKKYGKATTRLQINYYYDTEENTLNKKNVTVRVRQKDNGLKLQIKRHINKYEALFSSDEYFGDLASLPKTIKLNEIKEHLILKGSLVTERRTINFGGGGELCFDYNVYLGESDYEIEVEYSEQDKSSGESIVAIIDSSNALIGETKSNRFFKQWEEINNGQSVIAI